MAHAQGTVRWGWGGAQPWRLHNLYSPLNARTMRNDSALGQPLDARATNLLSTDTGGVKGSFSGRHNGLRDCIYDEAVRAGCAAHKEMELGTEHGLALKQEQFMKQQSRKARMRSRAERRKDLADACLKMRIDVTLTFPSTDEKIAAECKSTSWCKSHAPRRMRSGGRYSGRFATTVDYVAKKARIDRGDKADLIDNEGFEGRPTIRRALATLGTIEGYAVGGCCDLSTSTHHLVQRLGVEQGYNLAKESGRDLEEGIACATAGLRRRFAARVWRDYYKHVDARRRYANPTDEGLAAQQRDRQIEEESRRRENEERVAQYNYFAARASNRSAWARAGMG